jgi:N-acetylglucosaminyldiphosphoundecaprenol N-acetyl-beta-D-mannosaminyltransferase
MIKPKNKRTPVANIIFDVVTMQEAVMRIREMVSDCIAGQASGAYVCTGNLDHLVMLDRDEEFRRIYEQADLVLADGMPVVWLSQITGHTKITERVAGSDLFWELAKASHEHGLRLFFLGGFEGSAELAKKAVLAKHPNAQVCGLYCPPHKTFASEEEQAKIREIICEAKPDILFVGLGAPKQEKWIYENRYQLDVPVSIGVGGTFEMAGGVVKRAPMWMQQWGVEWSYRFIQDPRRLWKRYFKDDAPFLIKTLFRIVIARFKKSNRKILM